MFQITMYTPATMINVKYKENFTYITASFTQNEITID